MKLKLLSINLLLKSFLEEKSEQNEGVRYPLSFHVICLKAKVETPRESLVNDSRRLYHNS